MPPEGGTPYPQFAEQRLKRASLIRVYLCSFVVLSLVVLSLSIPCSAAPSADSEPESLGVEFVGNPPEGQKEDLRRLLAIARRALGPLPAETGIGRPITVEWLPTMRAFQRCLRLPPEHTMAAAEPSRRRILINAEAFNAADVAERQRTITHEYTHLILEPYSLPLWLEEGLAMRLSGETEHESAWRLTIDNSFGSLQPLTDLTGGFPEEPSARDQAYREAYSATSFLLATEYPGGGAQGLIADLMDPTRGPSVAARLQDPYFTRLLEASWRRSLKSLWGWLGVATSGSVIWGVATVLFLLAYLKRRRERKRQEEEAFDPRRRPSRHHPPIERIDVEQEEE
ncbi:MAG: hypothetical protein NTW86_13290 [Candidatus Sumerlaeota bacterium]|nr:hypothetical protein [Candidatus Sumerlaeota bacterium]